MWECPLRHSSLLLHIVLGSLFSKSLCWYRSSIDTYLSHRFLKSFQKPSSASLIFKTAVVCLVNMLTNQSLALHFLRKDFIWSVRSIISNGLLVWISISLVTNIFEIKRNKSRIIIIRHHQTSSDLIIWHHSLNIFIYKTISTRMLSLDFLTLISKRQMQYVLYSQSNINLRITSAFHISKSPFNLQISSWDNSNNSRYYDILLTLKHWRPDFRIPLMMKLILRKPSTSLAQALAHLLEGEGPGVR